MSIWAWTVARLRIGFRSEGECLPDRSTDRRGIGADTVEPAAPPPERAAALPRIAVITASSW
jgi:hypothetical protein